MIFVDLKVMVGNFSTSKKSGDLRCASRFGSRVSTVVASMVISAVLLVMSLSSCWMVAGGLAELTADVGHHQVLHDERALGVVGVHLPGGGGGGEGDEGCEGNERTHRVSPGIEGYAERNAGRWMPPPSRVIQRFRRETDRLTG